MKAPEDSSRFFLREVNHGLPDGSKNIIRLEVLFQTRRNTGGTAPITFLFLSGGRGRVRGRAVTTSSGFRTVPSSIRFTVSRTAWRYPPDPQITDRPSAPRPALSINEPLLPNGLLPTYHLSPARRQKTRNASRIAASPTYERNKKARPVN